MDFKELVIQARTCRRFKGAHRISQETLSDLIDCARLAASARNAQVLRFAAVTNPDVCAAMDRLVVLGGALTSEQKPTPNQHPGAYIAIIGPEIMDDFALMDVGIAAQTINLAANQKNLACCMIGAIKKKEIAELLSVPSSMTVRLVLALGEPDEQRRIVDRRPDGKLTYYRDEQDVHCVPKISLNEAIILKK